MSKPVYFSSLGAGERGTDGYLILISLGCDSSLGAAAAMQAFSKFMGGSSGGSSMGSNNASSGSGQSKLIGMAMAEAAKVSQAIHILLYAFKLPLESHFGY